MNVNGRLRFLLNCHLIVTCLVVRVIISFEVTIDIKKFLHKSHYMSKFVLCVSVNVQFLFVQVFACQMFKTLQKLCQKYTLVRGIIELGNV